MLKRGNAPKKPTMCTIFYYRFIDKKEGLKNQPLPYSIVTN